MRKRWVDEAFRDRAKIYATDVDEEALAIARQATYSAKELESVPEALRARYFAPSAGRYAFSADLRRAVIFGGHDLMQDAPISRLDLLVCRNTLMYFNSEAQAKIMARFHFALGPRGYLFLGKAEMMSAHSNLFEPVELKYRIFREVDQGRCAKSSDSPGPGRKCRIGQPPGATGAPARRCF